ncbi:MAG: hypothetical protein HYX32_01995 [Actinobacteria bacterium]|nr:hypothetical protein [Actinomycetota bacterium]
MTDDVDGRRRLRDALGHLLQVHQLCVLVGSGASYHLGSPSIRDVDASVVLSMAQRADLEITDEVKSLIEDLVAAGTDLEAFLGQIVAARTYARAFDLAEVEIAGTACSRGPRQHLPRGEPRTRMGL